MTEVFRRLISLYSINRDTPDIAIIDFNNFHGTPIDMIRILIANPTN